MDTLYKRFSNSRQFSLLITLISLFSLAILSPSDVKSQITLSLTKSNNAPTPVQTGMPFTYTLTYSWSGGAPGTLYIQDIVPPELDVLSALPTSPASTITGNQVNFQISGLTSPSGTGTVQINARFKPGETCGGVEACNVASITDDRNNEPDKWIQSNSDCVISADPENKWSFQKTKIAGCAIDDEVVYRICITSPGGTDIGGLNLYVDSLADLLPAGAIINDVTGWWSGPDGVTSSGSPINLTGGPTVLTVSPYPVWYCTYIKVSYPSPTFSIGQTVENKASLYFRTPCDTVNTQVWTDSVSTDLCEGTFLGTLNKYYAYNINFYNNPYYFPTFSPGCCGEYRMWYRNLGTLAQGPVVVEDTLSGDVDINSITTQIPSDPAILPVTLEIFTWNGSTCNTTPDTLITYTTSGSKLESTLPADICRLRWVYDTVPVNTIVRMTLDVCARDTNFKTGTALTPGYIATNEMDVQANSLNLSDEVDVPVDPTAPNIVTAKLFTGGCDGGTINPNGPFVPGDTVRYRLAVANVGSADALLANILDSLPSGMSYVGNETYFYGNFSYNVNAYNPNCNLFSTTVPTQIGGAINTPSVGDTILEWDFPVLPARCDGFVEFFLIEFDVVLDDDPPILAGQHENTFEFSSSTSGSQTSNVAVMTVNAIAQLQLQKSVRSQGSGSAWSDIDSVAIGSNAEFKLSILNTGNTPLEDICVLDITPWVGDISVLPPYNPRGSQFDLPYNTSAGAITTTPTGFTAEYNSAAVAVQQNPTRSSECGGFCGITDPFGAITGTFGTTPTNTFSYKVTANSGVSLPAGSTLDIIVPSTVPVASAVGDTACNSFAMQAVPAGLPNVCLSTESNNACVIAIEQQEPGPCLVLRDTSVFCKEVDKEGNQIYGLNMTLVSNLTFPTTLSITSSSGSFFSISPTTLPPSTPTTFTSDFITSLNAGDTLCFTIVLRDQEQRVVCEERICIIVPECDDRTECECPFEIKLDEFSAEQENGTSFSMVGLVATSGAYLKRVRATIVSSVITQNCNGQITSYNSGSVFTAANSWAGNSASGIGTPSLTWDSQDCDSLDTALQNYDLDIPFTSAKDCRLSVKMCIRYEFLDCKCTHCEEEVCLEFDIKNPVSGIVQEINQTDKVNSILHPNPADSWIKVDYSLQEATKVTIKLIDIKGTVVAKLIENEPMMAGSHKISYSTAELPSGAYFYVIETDDGSHIKPFVVAR
ncbi:MAG: hypothetical protein Kapaf2KO_06890 [Candidatus Kapaibacteriales bacterium]